MRTYYWKNIFDECSGNKVLELACGTGRLAIPLIREGAIYTGLDLIDDFVKSAQLKLNNYKNQASILQGDMRKFDLGDKFDIIFIGFNSFLHLLTDEDAKGFFDCVKNHMHKKSRFIIDIYVPNPLFLYRPEGMIFPVLEYTDSITGELVYVRESNDYDTETEINEITWYFSTDKKQNFEINKFLVRMYFPSKMNQLIIDEGFTILNQWGDYYRQKLGEASKLQIYDICLD